MRGVLMTLPTPAGRTAFLNKFRVLINAKELRTRSTRFMVTKNKQDMVTSLCAYLNPEGQTAAWRHETSLRKRHSQLSRNVGLFLGGTVIHRDGLFLLDKTVLAELSESDAEGIFAVSM